MCVCVCVPVYLLLVFTADEDVDNEEVYKMAAVMSENGGLQVLLQRSVNR